MAGQAAGPNWQTFFSPVFFSKFSVSQIYEILLCEMLSKKYVPEYETYLEHFSSSPGSKFRQKYYVAEILLLLLRKKCSNQ